MYLCGPRSPPLSLDPLRSELRFTSFRACTFQLQATALRSMHSVSFSSPERSKGRKVERSKGPKIGGGRHEDLARLRLCIRSLVLGAYLGCACSLLRLGGAVSNDVSLGRICHRLLPSSASDMPVESGSILLTT
eukprot:scaffold845_cov231-Pinguiococcus_pyrenoidosus.AAC.17